MESFWGMMKSEMFYINRFYTYEELEAAVTAYIDFYNDHRYQKRLNGMAPLEYREYLAASLHKNDTDHREWPVPMHFVFFTVYLTGSTSRSGLEGFLVLSIRVNWGANHHETTCSELRSQMLDSCRRWSPSIFCTHTSLMTSTASELK